MAAVAYIVLGGLVAFVLLALVFGGSDPKTGAEILDWRLTRSVELEAELELQDVAQMLDAQNERRRARGDRERTLEEVELEVAAHLRTQVTRPADPADLAAELEHVNARRARRGQAPLTIAELEG